MTDDEPEDEMAEHPHEGGPPPPLPPRLSPWLAGAIGMALGIVIATVMCVVTDEDPPAVGAGATNGDSTVVVPTTTTADPGAASEQAVLVDAFLDAWFHYRTSDLSIEWAFERRRDDGEVLASPAVLVQRPPDRLYGLLGSVSGTYQGTLVNCDALSDERRCFESATSADYLDQMRTEQGTRSTFFLGQPPLYQLAAAGAGCFDVTSVGAASFLPWGESAQFCFDPATGALTSSTIDYGALVESFQALSVSADVTEDQFNALLATEEAATTGPPS